ncbi:MAG: hypothetical protein KDH15_20285 [Rhodocyclaceae bacterium]|nr:hypothetical protein [Rhodocyclaceae bacterium]
MSEYCGEVSFADPAPLTCTEPSDGFLCSLPAADPGEAVEFLEIVGSGGALGTGARMTRMGISMPVIREEYEAAVRKLVAEVARRKRSGQSLEAIARFAVEERTRIANRMRWRSGAGTRILFEVRDWSEFGPGGRTYRNVEARYVGRGYQGSALHQKMIAGATHPNAGISNTALRGARYLRNGGRVIVVLSFASTAYVLLTTPEEQLPRVLSQEAGSFLGGAAGSGAAVGACLVFGIATGGWGLLACGIVGGIAGGAVGDWAGDRVYSSLSPNVEESVRATGMLDVNELIIDGPDAPMCVAPLTR